jgi:hypothetical protein
LPLRVRNLSSDLLLAQCRLEKLRVEYRRASQSQPSISWKGGSTAVTPLASPLSSQTFSLPPHLGWHSQTLANFLQTSVSANHFEKVVKKAPSQLITDDKSQPKQILSFPTALKVYPDIAIGLLQHELAAVGRIWLLLRCLDRQGRGWVSQTEAILQFTDKSSKLHVCGRRHLRNLLVNGEGMFWVRVNGRIWLRSLTKVASALGAERLRLKPVLLPVEVLTQRIGTVRAHLYATFHSSRGSNTRNKKEANPIARATIEKITHVQPRIQRLYEKKARVKRHRHFGIGTTFSKSAAEESRWQHGRAVFELIDTCGRQGKPGQSYLAWQLPNSYSGPHDVLHGARCKRDNQKLTDLLRQGTTGNGQLQPPTNASWGNMGRRYCENGRIATKLLAKNPSGELYWPARTISGQIQTWHQIGSIEERKK